MDEVTITAAQLKALVARNCDITIRQVNGDARMIFFERTKYVGTSNEGKWMMPNGKLRELKEQPQRA
jgi:hypothetical protein